MLPAICWLGWGYSIGWIYTSTGLDRKYVDTFCLLYIISIGNLYRILCRFTNRNLYRTLYEWHLGILGRFVYCIFAMFQGSWCHYICTPGSFDFAWFSIVLKRSEKPFLFPETISFPDHYICTPGNVDFA